MMRIESATTSSENETGSSRIVPSKEEGIALCTAFILTSMFIVVRNLLTIVLFAVNRYLRKSGLFLVINMACADLTLGTVCLSTMLETAFNFGEVVGRCLYKFLRDLLILFSRRRR